MRLLGLLILVIGIGGLFTFLGHDPRDRIAVEQVTGTLVEVHRRKGDANDQALFANLGLIELADGTRTRLPLGDNPPEPGASIPLEMWIYDNGDRVFRLSDEAP